MVEVGVESGAAERGGPHAGVDKSEVIVYGVEVFEECDGSWAECVEDFIVAWFDAEVVPETAEKLEECGRCDFWQRKCLAL